MNRYRISQISVKGLWGRRTLKISFNEDMNIVIGPNASGKTTLINLLHCVLTADLIALSQITFTNIRILLRSFDGDDDTELEVHQTDEAMTMAFGETKVSIPMRLGRYPDVMYAAHPYRRHLPQELHQIRESVLKLVPAVWLPVSRRLPIADEEDVERRRLHRMPLESVDECLQGLLESLKSYRISLDSYLSELRKTFQRHALETILYDKQHDKLPSVPDVTPFSRDERQQLIQAFSDVGCDDARIRKRIDEHFAAAEEAAKKIADRGALDVVTLFSNCSHPGGRFWIN